MKQISSIVLAVCMGCSTGGGKTDAVSPNLDKSQPTPVERSGPSQVSKVDALSSSPRKADNLEMACTSAEDRRILTSVPKDPGCELHYQKFGHDQIVAQSAHGTSYCERVKARIQSNLEAAGFECK